MLILKGVISTSTKGQVNHQENKNGIDSGRGSLINYCFRRKDAASDRRNIGKTYVLTT